MKLLLGICVLDRPRTFEKCLKLLLDCERRNDISIVIVNNGSNEQTCEVIEKHIKDVDMIIHHSWNTGYCFGINSWMSKREKGQACAIVDEDMFMHSKDWLTRAEKILNDPSIGVVAGRRPSAWIDRQDKKDFFSYNVIGEKLNGIWVEVPAHNLLVGPILIYKGEVLDILGFENEATGYEDIDFAYRVKALGYKSVYIPDIFLYQLGNPDFEDAKGLDEVCKHPQLRAHQDLMKIRASLHNTMVSNYMAKGNVFCGTRFLPETMLDPEYTKYSDQNWIFHKRWPNV
jgi:glycosyltransferase involved in cell wall biosynthesis